MTKMQCAMQGFRVVVRESPHGRFVNFVEVSSTTHTSRKT